MLTILLIVPWTLLAFILVIILNGLDQHLHSLSDEVVPGILSGNDFLSGYGMIERVGLCMLWVCELTIHLLPKIEVDVPDKWSVWFMSQTCRTISLVWHTHSSQCLLFWHISGMPHFYMLVCCLNSNLPNVGRAKPTLDFWHGQSSVMATCGQKPNRAKNEHLLYSC